MNQIDRNSYFPQYLGGMFQILNWDLDVVMVTVFSVALGSKAGRFFALDLWAAATWAFVIFFPILYARIKADNPNGHIKHLLYKIGLRPYPYYPDSFVKTFSS